LTASDDEGSDMATDRRAEVTWRGSLLEGSGTIESTTSGAFGGLGVTWKARSEDETGGLTSPEELIAAAHAACFSMALSAGLARAGTPAEELRTSATVTFQPGEGITRIALTVDGRVPGLDEDGFRAAAQTAKENCPVSKALAGVPEITLEARLV
jgi:lipoyl-dependent peroxiredoxin